MTKYISGYKVKEKIKRAIAILAYILTALTGTIITFTLPNETVKPLRTLFIVSSILLIMLLIAILILTRKHST